jgi:hypothetical protein
VKPIITLLLVLFFALTAVAGDGQSDKLAVFSGGIGVIPGGIGVPASNIVRGVNPPGQIWVIREFAAAVNTDGRIRAAGRGLLLGGGNGIGSNANQSVHATLMCANDGNVQHTTPTLVALDPNGDFVIDEVAAPPVPATCTSPVLLIRNGGGAWFAAGIPRNKD